MVDDLDMPVEVIGMPIVREADGLALSSRNVRLSPEARSNALALPRALKAAGALIAEGERRARASKQRVLRHLEASGGSVDYVALVDAHSLAPVDAMIDGPLLVALAVWYGDVRLIDNRKFLPR